MMIEFLRSIWCRVFAPCLVCVMRSAVGLSYGDPRFTRIVAPYWTRGKGTTCAVTVEWGLSECGWRGPLNRGPNWIVGAHLRSALQWAERNGMVTKNPPLDSLRPGDVIYLEGATSTDWHVGVVEKNEFPRAIVTLDGGQSDVRGEQMIGRVVRPINERGELGPKFRRVKLAMRPR